MPNLSPLKITLYGVDNEIKREVTRSIIPWGILERAIDLRDAFENVETDAQGNPLNVDKDQIAQLTDFVVFMFDDAVTADELKRGASLGDMFALYRQIFSMVAQSMPANPTPALTPKQNLQKVRQGRR
jgi:hypothetical protein